MRRSIVKRWALLLLGVAASLGAWAQAGQTGDAFITLWDLSLPSSEVWTGKGAPVQGAWADYEKLPPSDGATLYFPGRGSQSCIVEFLRADKNPQTDEWTPVPIAPDQFTTMKPLKIQFPEADQRWYVRVFPKDADGKDAFWEFRMGHWREEWEGNWRLFGDASRLVRVVSWGRVNWVGLEAAFFGCSNLEQLPLIDDPKFPDRVLLPGKVTGIIDYLFSGCKKLKTTNSANKVEWTLADWDVSDATRMRGLFKECELYNDNLAQWNVGKVTDFYEAFKLAKKFDCDISRWDMRRVVCVSWMFSGTEAFNVDLALWKFENLEEMTEMVSYSRAFNRPLGRWNLSKVKKAASFAKNATALKTRNIDHLLLGWGAQATTPGEGFSRFIWISPNSHSARSQEGYNSLTGKGWKIMGETTENPYEYHKLEGIRLSTHDIYAQKGQQTSLEAILDVARVPSNATYGEIYAIQAGDDTDKAFVTPAGSIWAYEVGEVQLTITTLEGDFRENVTLHVVDEANCTVRLHPRNGDDERTLYIPKGSVLARPEDPTKAGKRFAGWYTDAGCTTPYDFTQSVTQDLDLYAKWADGAVVTFDAKGGAPTPNELVVNLGDKIDPSEIDPLPKKEGYTLAGWCSDEDCENPWDFSANEVNGNITLYAKWIKAYTVTFHPNNGEADFTEIVEEGKFAKGPVPEPTKEGFTLGGWYTDNGSWGDKWELATRPVTADVDLYAKWVTLHTVTFHLNNGQPDFIETVEHGKTAKGPQDLTKDCSNFAYWNTSDGHEWTLDSDPVTEDRELFAIWVPKAVTVTFDSKGGTSVPPQNKTCGETVTEPTGVTRAQYTLAGWYSDEACSDDHVWDFNTPLSGDITLYAKWLPDLTITYTITFDAKGGSPTPAPQSKHYGEKVDKPKDVTLAGSKLAGWYLEPTYDHQWNFDNNTVTGEMTLYAKWLPEDEPTFTVTFHPNNGQGDILKHVPQNMPAGDPYPVPTKEGHNVAGWFTTEDLNVEWNIYSTPVTHDMELWAKWVPGHYTVTFHPNIPGNPLFTEDVSYGSFILKPLLQGYPGYTLIGWYTDNGIWTDKWDFDHRPVLRNLNLYAYWATAHTVTLHPNNDTEDIHLTVAHGALVQIPAGITKECHVLKAWYTDAGLTHEWATATQQVSQDMELWAKWELKPIKVTFESNGGTAVPERNKHCGETVDEPSGVTRAGFALKGWYTDQPPTQKWNFSTPLTEDITLYAKWIALHTVTFHLNNGETNITETVEEGKLANGPTPAPSKTGFTFGGWYTDDGTWGDKWELATRPVTADVDLYAKWDPITYTVTFDAKGGTPTPPSQSKHYGEKVGAPPVVTKAGFTLEGWYTDEQLTPASKWDFDNSTVTESITLYAKWVAAHTVTFHLDNGLPDFPETVEDGKFATGPTPAPTKTGFTFDAWYTDNGTWGDKWELATRPVTADVDLYAKWNPITYTVTFHLDNGQPDFIETVEHGKTAKGPQDLAKDCSNFAYWNTSDGHEWVLDSEPVTQDMELFAIWVPKSVTVTFDSKGGTAVPPQSKVCGDKVDAPTGVTKDGYTLEGWYTDEQLTPASKWDFDNSTVTGDITLYAKWTEDSYTVTFDAKGGSPTPPSQSKHYGDRVEEPSGVTKAGFTLEGWYTDEQLTPTKKWDFVNNPVTESITLYAKWIVLHTVTFHLNNGETDITETVEDGKLAKGPTSEPIREGFTFGGWYTDNNDWTDKWDLATRPVTADVDLYAKWKPKTYDFVVIVLDENGNPIEGATVIIKDKPSLTASDGKARYKLTEGADYSCSVSKKGYIQGSGTFKIPLEGEITITLKSAPSSYTVTIDLQDGSSPTKHGVAPEEKFPQPSTPLRSGYLFVAWTTDREGTHPYNFETPVTGDLTLYAQWKKDSQIDAVEALTEVTMAPNPFSSTLRLEHAERILHLVVYTATGHRLVELAHSGAPSIVLNTSRWVDGLYMIRVTGAEGSRVLTAVKH